MSSTLPDDWDSVTTWDTPLHTVIEASFFETSDGDSVVYHPENHAAHIKSTVSVDTYDER